MIRELNASAREECEAVNDEGRRLCRLSGNWEHRIWFHPQEWVRIRPPIYILAHIAKADDEITETENSAVSKWINDWMKRSHWGDFYSESKNRALEILIARLQTNRPDFMSYCKICREKLSALQKSKLLIAIDEMGVPKNEITLEVVLIARSALAID